MAETKIEWTWTLGPDGILHRGFTLNFWIGCQEVSPACDFCYAKTQNLRRHWVDGWGPHGQRRRTQYWNDARRWNRMARDLGVRLKVFSNSLSDFFDKAVDDKPWRDDAWALIDECRDLDWLILTKRPQNIPNRLPVGWMRQQGDGKPFQPWPHVWFGTTTENQEEADRRIPHLLAVPAAKRFLSCEPLLGAVRLDMLTRYVQSGALIDNALTGFSSNGYGGSYGSKIDWVIAGGESGPDARSWHPDWARSLRDQCSKVGVPFFWKQNGEWSQEDAHRKVVPHAMANDGTLYRSGDLAWPNGARRGEAIRADHDKAHLTMMYRVGKKAAGALLDGVEHRAMPT